LAALVAVAPGRRILRQFVAAARELACLLVIEQW